MIRHPVGQKLPLAGAGLTEVAIEPVFRKSLYVKELFFFSANLADQGRGALPEAQGGREVAG